MADSVVVRALRHGLCCLVAGVMLIASVTTAGQAHGADDEALRVSVVDRELASSLERVGLLDEWLEASAHGAEVSLVQIRADERTTSQRAQLIALADALASSRADEVRLLQAVDQVETSLTILSNVAREARSREVRGEAALADADFVGLRKQLLQARATTEHIELASVLQTIDRLRGDLGDHVVQARVRRPDAKNVNSADLSLMIAELDAVADELAALRERASQTTVDEAELTGRVIDAIVELQDARRSAVSTVDGLPLVVLDAYVRGAEQRSAGCGVDWRLLAGIGRIESIHGTLGGASVSSTGRAAPAIFGPLLDGGATEREAEEARLAAEEALRLEEEEAARVLAEERARFASLYGELYRGDDDDLPATDDGGDGADDADADAEGEGEAEEEDEGNGFAVIEDTDNGSLDGNARWDRAVGPMQFLPGTWRLYGSDGNGDGVVDPHNLYDAAGAAADYLCHLERRNGPDPTRFVLGYNDSDRYVAAVLSVVRDLRAYDIGLDG